jgi:tetratricopeptide (TPR) repeat protein
LFVTEGWAQTDDAATIARLTSAADAALREQRFGDALTVLADLAKRRPKDPSVAFGIGYAAASLGQLAEARPWLERALTLQPRFLEASQLLGEVLYRQGKVADALAVYDAALKFAPSDKMLLSKRDQWRRESQIEGRFYETRGAHFSVVFEGPADDVAARQVVELLEQAYFRIGRALSTYPSDPIAVVLYTRQQFSDVTRSPAWVGGAYDGRIKIPMLGALEHTTELRRILEHEFVHALVASLAGSAAPVWLNEGLASVLEPRDLQWASDILSADSNRLTYSQLERGFNRLSGREAAIAYAQSALAVKKLIDLRGPGAIVALLQSLGSGVPFPEAFQGAMGMRLDELQSLIARL